LSKTYPGGREVLKDAVIVFAGAKTACLVPTAPANDLLRIKAGSSATLAGRAGRGGAVGYRAQEPVLDSGEGRVGNVARPGETRAPARRFEAVSARFGRGIVARRDGRITPSRATCRKIDQADAGTDRTNEIAMDALRCPRAMPTSPLVGRRARRVALCRLLLQRPTCCCSTTDPISTPSRWPGCRRFLHDFPHRRHRDAHRYSCESLPVDLELDRAAAPLEGTNGWLERSSALEPKAAGEARRRSLDRVGGAAESSGAPGQAARVSATSTGRTKPREAPDTAQIRLPPGPRLGDLVVEAEVCARRLATDCWSRI